MNYRTQQVFRGMGMVLAVVAVVALIASVVMFNRWYVQHRLEKQGYHVTDLSMAWINKHPFWCAGHNDSKGQHESAPIYWFTYTTPTGPQTGFACEQGWLVYAWPDTNFSMFN